MAGQSKQISRFLEATLGIVGFSSSGGTSDTITSALTSLLSTAGDNGVSVPLQVGNAASGTEGVEVGAGLNATGVYNGTTGQRLQDANGNDVYAKISNTGNVWTLAYFSAPGGTETAYTMASGTSISFDVAYIFSFAHLPYNAISRQVSRHLTPDLASFAFRSQSDALTVTAANTLSSLSQSYKTGGMFLLIVNQFVYTNLGTSPVFSVSGTTITWNPSNIGFALAPGDDVKAFYQY